MLVSFTFAFWRSLFLVVNHFGFGVYAKGNTVTFGSPPMLMFDKTIRATSSFCIESKEPVEPKQKRTFEHYYS